MLPTSCTSPRTSWTFPSTLLTLSSTPITLPSTLCVTFSSSTDAIRASSCVNLSNLSRLSSMSLFPANFMKYFSEQRRSGGVTVYTGHELTESSTFRFLRHDREGCQHLNHNVNGHVRHCRSRRDAGVYLKPVEETFDAV